jgi:hypothetical protein
MKFLMVLGPGFDEKLYEEAMIVVLKKYGHVPDQQMRHSPLLRFSH